MPWGRIRINGSGRMAWRKEEDVAEPAKTMLGCKLPDIGLAGWVGRLGWPVGLAGCVAELLTGHMVKPTYTLDGSEGPGVFLLGTW